MYKAQLHDVILIDSGFGFIPLLSISLVDFSNGGQKHDNGWVTLHTLRNTAIMMDKKYAEAWDEIFDNSKFTYSTFELHKLWDGFHEYQIRTGMFVNPRLSTSFPKSVSTTGLASHEVVIPGKELQKWGYIEYISASGIDSFSANTESSFAELHSLIDNDRSKYVSSIVFGTFLDCADKSPYEIFEGLEHSSVWED